MLSKPFNLVDRELNDAESPYMYGYPDVYGDGDGPEASPYYWWFQYLRRHEGYIRCCERGGGGDHAELYNDWGDVRTDDFEDWFFNHGDTVFREPHVSDQLTEIKDPSDLEGIDWKSVMVIVSPIRIGTKILSKRDIKRQFAMMVDARFANSTPGRPVYDSAAKYRVAGYPNLTALEQMLHVYDLRIAEPNLKLWEIGERLHQEKKLSSGLNHVTLPSERGKEGDAKRRVMTAIVSRHFRIATAYIASAVGPVFPVK